ncbi:MAG: Mth938-like domain-containing protein [Gammaproteobacteria bacterium]
MKFEIDRGAGRYSIRGYDERTVTVNEVALSRSFVLMPDLLIEQWVPQCLQDLTSEHLEALIPHQPELVILGSGRRLVFPDAAIIEPLRRAGIGHETMDTAAACRCFTVLAAEGRRVLAIMFPISG